MVVTINADTVNIGALIETTGNANNFQINITRSLAPVPVYLGTSTNALVSTTLPLDLLSVNENGK